MEQNDKKAHILEAAIRRFAHFGVQKTTLTEIADDLGMTKQALAYYFPDKEALANAVQEKIVDEFFEMVAQHTSAAASTEQALLALVEVKKSFFEKYAMLVQRVVPEIGVSHSKITESRQQVQEKLMRQIAGILEQGVARGELKPMDATEVSGLLFDTMAAYEQCFMGRQAVPDPQSFASMCSRQKAVVQLIVNGLKQETWKH